jgi:hypothetical protein
MNFSTGDAGSQFFSVREASRDAYRVSASDAKKWEKLAPAPRVAAKIGPYFVVDLDLGATKAIGLRLVWPDFRSQRCPWKSS